ncbi:hypothetical protein QJS10_CPB13g00315 [Acorus calamus]|uniref:Uncharacterized protein n=1 Tax=Acorus calamus TaxID=4465 RepID=A0AAV9DHB1_ACOCL|nr:hypothetical protein QJS10_CPB13g00315 [Acorus calamus]
MLRRKPSKIEVKAEDKEELLESRKKPKNPNPSSSIHLLHQLDKALDPSNKPHHRIGISHPSFDPPPPYIRRRWSSSSASPKPPRTTPSPTEPPAISPPGNLL